jgi:uncharacterized RDD family membrane protein YckC
MATVIDMMFVLIVAIVLAYALNGVGATTLQYRLYTIGGFILLYEPLCTSKLCTIGQWIMGIRVRDYKKGVKISIPSAYVRIVIKIVLGFISFLTIPIDSAKRGIHDIVVGSIVILKEEQT